MAATATSPSRAPPPIPSNSQSSSNSNPSSNKSAALAKAVELENQSREPVQSFRPNSTWSINTGNHDVVFNGEQAIPPPLPNKHNLNSSRLGDVNQNQTNDSELEDERFSDANSWEGTGTTSADQQAMKGLGFQRPAPRNQSKLNDRSREKTSSSSYDDEANLLQTNDSSVPPTPQTTTRQSTYGHARDSSVGSSIWAGKGVTNSNPSSSSYSSNRAEKDANFQFPPPLPSIPRLHANSNSTVQQTPSSASHLNSPMLSPGLASEYSSYEEDQGPIGRDGEGEEERYGNPNEEESEIDWRGDSSKITGNGEMEDKSTPELHSIESYQQDESLGQDGFEMVSGSSPDPKHEEEDEGMDSFTQDLPSSSNTASGTGSGLRRFMPDGTPIPNIPPMPTSASPGLGSASNMPSRSGSSSGGQRRTARGRRNRSPVLSYADGAEAEEALFAQQQAEARGTSLNGYLQNGISLDEDEVVDENGRRGPRLKKNSPAPWELEDEEGSESMDFNSPTSANHPRKFSQEASTSNHQTHPSSSTSGGMGPKFRGAAAKLDTGRRSTESSRGAFSFGRDKDKSSNSNLSNSNNYQSSTSIDDFGAQRSSTSTDHQIPSSSSGGKTSLFSNARARSKSVSGGVLKGLGLGGGSSGPPPLPPDVIAINPSPLPSSAASFTSSNGKKSKLAKAFRRNDDDHGGSGGKKNLSLAAGISSSDYFPSSSSNDTTLDSNPGGSTTSNFNSNLVNPFGSSAAAGGGSQSSHSPMPTPLLSSTSQAGPPSPYSVSSAQSDGVSAALSPNATNLNLPPAAYPYPSSQTNSSNSQIQNASSLFPMGGNPSPNSSQASGSVNNHQRPQNIVRSGSPNTAEGGGGRISAASSADGATGGGSTTVPSERTAGGERELLLTGGRYITSPTRSRFGAPTSPNPGASPLHSPSPSSPGGLPGSGSIFSNQQQRSASSGTSRTGSNVSYKRSSTFFDDRSTPPIRQASVTSTSNSQTSNESPGQAHPVNPISSVKPQHGVGETQQSISSLQGDGFGGYVGSTSPQPSHTQLSSSASTSSNAGTPTPGSLPPNLGISTSGSFPRPGEGAPYKLISLEQARMNQMRQQQAAQQQALASAKERKEKARVERMNNHGRANDSNSNSPVLNFNSNQLPPTNSEESTRPALISQNSSDTLITSGGKQLKNKKSGFLRMFNKERENASSENMSSMRRNGASSASLDEASDNVSSMPNFNSSNMRSASGNVPSIETDNASSSGHGHLGKGMEVPALKSLRPMSSMFSGFGSDLLDPLSLADSGPSSGLLAPTSPALTTRSFESGSRASSGLYEDAQANSPLMPSSSNLAPASPAAAASQKLRQAGPPKSIATPSYSTVLPGPVPPLSASSLGSDLNPTYSPRTGRQPSLDNSQASVSDHFASPLTSPTPINPSNDEPQQSFAHQQQTRAKEREPKERLRRLPNANSNEARPNSTASSHSDGSSLGLVNGFPSTPLSGLGAGPPSPAWRNRVIEIEATILELTSELTKIRMEHAPDAKVNLQTSNDSVPNSPRLEGTEDQEVLSSNPPGQVPPCHSCGCSCADQRRLQALNEVAVLKGINTSTLNRGRGVKPAAAGSGKFGGYLGR